VGVKILNKQEVGNQSFPASKKNIDKSAWNKFVYLTIAAWILFILISLLLCYCPPHESAKETASVLCGGLSYLASVMTGAALGYPFGKS
jgi:hypothetical protein